MALQFRESLRNAFLDALLDAMGEGDGAAIVAFYSGAKPATAATALDNNTLLAQIAFAEPAGAVSGGELTIDTDPVLEVEAAAAGGTATFFRVYSSDDGETIDEQNVVAQGTVTATGGGGDIELTTTTITQGQPVRITSWKITAPGA